MKQILVELDDACARDLERVAPAKKRQRAEFIRLAIRRAVDLALDRATEAAYGRAPLPAVVEAADLLGWDTGNALAVRGSTSKASSRLKRKRAAA